MGIDHYYPHLPDVLAQAEKIPILSGSIGIVFCMELLEHVPDEQRVLSEINRVICSDGYLLLSLSGLGIPKHEKLPFQRDYRRISPEQAENLLRANGFRNIEIDVKTFRGLQVNIFAICKRDED